MEFKEGDRVVRKGESAPVMLVTAAYVDYDIACVDVEWFEDDGRKRRLVMMRADGLELVPAVLS